MSERASQLRIQLKEMESRRAQVVEELAKTKSWNVKLRAKFAEPRNFDSRQEQRNAFRDLRSEQARCAIKLNELEQELARLHTQRRALSDELHTYNQTDEGKAHMLRVNQTLWVVANHAKNYLEAENDTEADNHGDKLEEALDKLTLLMPNWVRRD